MAEKNKKNRRSTTSEDAAIFAEGTSDLAAGQRMVDAMGGNLKRSSEEQGALDARKSDYDYAVSNPNQDALMAKHMAATEGIDSTENQALRAQMIRSEQGGTQSAIRGMRAAGASAGMTGGSMGSAYRGIYRDAAMARALGESDLVAKNIGFKQEALKAASDYQNQVTTNRLAAGDRYATDTLNTAAAEKENWMQTYLGGMGLNIARRGARRGEKLGEKALEYAQNAYN